MKKETINLIHTLSEPCSNYEDIDICIKEKLKLTRKLLKKESCILVSVCDDIDDIIAGKKDLNKAFT